jgi:CRISPR type III-B/RAMP module RAMP protein Cmr6
MKVFTSRDVQQFIRADAQGVRNRSLLADRFPFFTDRPDDKKDHAAARQKSVDILCKPGLFEEGIAWKTRRDALARLGGAVSVKAKLGARLIINQAGGVIENAGICLDRNSGVPYIPGSAVKGIARAGAAMIGANPGEIALVFGWTSGRSQEPDLPAKLPVRNFGGTVSFLPAFPTGTARIEADIVTVHHRLYYSDPEKKPVAYDDEEPLPNTFPTIARGTEFQFVLTEAGSSRSAGVREGLGVASSSSVLELARSWLLAGLTEHGIGAKTAAGYGWFQVDTAGAAEPAAKPVPDFNEASFRNAIEKRLDRKGEWGILKKELEKLHKPVNAEWKTKFLALVGKDKAYKDLRAIVEAS